jgi:hypothetical protein
MRSSSVASLVNLVRRIVVSGEATRWPGSPIAMPIVYSPRSSPASRALRARAATSSAGVW